MSDARQPQEATFTAFLGDRRIASGLRDTIAVLARVESERAPADIVRIFDDASGDWYSLDSAFLNPRPSARSIDGPVNKEQPGRGPGRPKLGVVPREVTLLPRHWAWLNTQPGGASAALRRLVEAARRNNAGVDEIRRAREATYRFLSVMVGDQPGFEEATRALFGNDERRFTALASAWPDDIAAHATRLAAAGFAGEQHRSS